MREIRLHGSEGGGTESTGSSYPYSGLGRVRLPLGLTADRASGENGSDLLIAEGLHLKSYPTALQVTREPAGTLSPFSPRARH